MTSLDIFQILFLTIVVGYAIYGVVKAVFFDKD